MISINFFSTCVSREDLNEDIEVEYLTVVWGRLFQTGLGPFVFVLVGFFGKLQLNPPPPPNYILPPPLLLHHQSTLNFVLGMLEEDYWGVHEVSGVVYLGVC